MSLSIQTVKNYIEFFRGLEAHQLNNIERAQRQLREAEKATAMWEATLKQLEGDDHG